MHRTRALAALAAALAVGAGAVGGAVAFRPSSAPARQHQSGGGAPFHQPVPSEFRSMLGEMSSRNIET